MTDTPTGFIVTYTSAPFGVNATLFPDFDIDPETGQIIVTAWLPFDVVEVEQTIGVVLLGQPGGWLADREHKVSKKRQKIKAKQERRQDFVMRKIFAELRGLEPDERLLALMAEFETAEDLVKADSQIQAEFRKAFFDFIIVKRERQAKQDRADENAIMLAMSELL